VTGPPLSDLLVVELASDVAGAYCGKCLAGLGARVIKVEALAGDPLREVGPFAGGAPHRERGSLFLWLNTAKESVSLNLASDEGAGLLARLIAKADLLVVSPAQEQILPTGWSVASLAERHPGLIVIAVSPFGLSGPHAGWTADDLVLAAMTGWMHMTGRPEREPLGTFETLPSAVTGVTAAVAALMAVHERAGSGRGQTVEVSAQEVLALCTAYIAVAYSYTGIERPRSGMPFPMTLVPAADGVLGINILTQAQWEALCAFAGLTDLLENPDFSTPLGRAQHAAELTQRFRAWASDKRTAEVFHEGQQWRVPFGYVPALDEVERLAPHVARDFFETVVHPEAGEAKYPRIPFVIRGTGPVQPAPLLGEDTRAVLAESGCSETDLADLAERGVI
jgi:crotonobetainyl-CoA:carnitine CoA-transferase CaiB-like acyl-CoA transferase